MDGFAYSFATWLIALGGLHVGAHFASLIPPLSIRHKPSHAIDQEKKYPPKQPSPSSTYSEAPHTPRWATTYDAISKPTPVLDSIAIASAVLSYLAALLIYFLAPAHWRHPASESILFAPLGTIVRFALSKINTRPAFQDRFPLGTFIANMAATLLISACFALQRRPEGRNSTVACNTLYAVQQGFCGCLSTVSTFVVESRAIKRKRDKWIYVGGSVILGHVFVLAIVGGIGWDRGYQGVCG